MDIQDMRRARLAKLIKDFFGGSQAQFIDKTNENQSEISALLNTKKSFGEKKARKIEEKCGLPIYWLDGDVAHSGSAGDMVRGKGTELADLSNVAQLIVLYEQSTKDGKKQILKMAQDAEKLASSRNSPKVKNKR